MRFPTERGNWGNRGTTRSTHKPQVGRLSPELRHFDRIHDYRRTGTAAPPFWLILARIMRAVAISFGLAAGLAAFSCVHRPSNLLLGQPVQKPVSVFLHVSKEAGETDELGGTAAVVEAVTKGLEERGIQSRLYTSDHDHPPTPRIEVWVEKWDPGNRGARSGASAAGVLVSPIAGAILHAGLSGNFMVASRLFRDGDTEPSAVLGYAGSISSSSDTASIDKGTSVGSTIVDDAFARHPELRTGHCLMQVCQ